MTDGPATMSPSERGWKAGLLIALLGPPLGALILLAQFSISDIIYRTDVTAWTVIADSLRTLLPLMLISYIFAGIPAIVVALYVGIRIGTRGWLSWVEFLILSLVIPFMALVLWRGVEAFSAFSLILLPHTLLTAFILRYLMLRWGLMKRPGMPMRQLGS